MPDLPGSNTFDVNMRVTNETGGNPNWDNPGGLRRAIGNDYGIDLEGTLQSFKEARATGKNVAVSPKSVESIFEQHGVSLPDLSKASLRNLATSAIFPAAAQAGEGRSLSRLTASITPLSLD